MTLKIFFSALFKFLLGVFLVGALVFLPAGNLLYVNGWLLMAMLFLPMLAVGIVMMIRDPELLKRRLKGNEKEREQSLVVKLSGLMFMAGFVVAGLGYRFGWYMLPRWMVTVAAVFFLASYILYAEVLRENSYLSRTIEVGEDQNVIDTGLYGIVRHPMYCATVVMFLSIPIILGSVYAFAIFMFYPFIIAKRIKHEERFLEKELNGYTEYKKKVKYRLIPFVW